MTQMLRFKVKTTPNKTTVQKMLQALFFSTPDIQTCDVLNFDFKDMASEIRIVECLSDEEIENSW